MKAEIKIKEGYFKQLENNRDIYGKYIEPIYEEVELIESPLWFHKKGLLYTSSGYGSKIPTSYKVKFKNRLYRVYCTIYSNSGSTWIKSKGEKYYVSL